jgi:DNA helicase-2/ATP-dependent DNA helicase PcrA
MGAKKLAEVKKQAKRANISAEKHPDYLSETNRLENTISAIQHFIESIRTTRASGGDRWATENLKRFYAERIAGYREAMESPYFGRIDFSTDGDDPKEYYFGYRALDLRKYEVIDWRAPAGKLFYGSNAERQSYNAPKGLIQGRLLLKRRYQIESRRLLDIADEVDRRPIRPAGVKMVSADAYLLQTLYSRGDPRLQDIVKTIQEQQDRIIRAPFNRTLIINGVAGSGKTSIAYHRLAFLLYPDTTQGYLLAQNTIIFAPNRIFLSYVADLLPQLGIRDVNQVTFDDWALEYMRLAILRDGIYRRKYKLQEVSIQTFLNPSSSRRERIVHWKRARLKGSLKIQKILENYVQYQKNRITLPSKGLVFRDLGEIRLSLGVSAEEIHKSFEETFAQSSPYHQLRERFISGLNRLIAGKYEGAVNEEYNKLLHTADQTVLQADARGDNALRERAEQLIRGANQFRNRAFAAPVVRQRVLAQARDQLAKEMDKLWPRVDLYQGYYQLLSDRALLQRCGKGVLSRAEIDLMTSYIPEDQSLDLEDIPALLCLYLLLDGPGDRKYDHVVVDEAQDFSPLHFHLLRTLYPKASMTIVGDIAQGIYAHRGLSNWDEIFPLFNQDSLRQEHVNQNYRSTQEIVEFNNRVLRAIKRKDVSPVIPFQRSGQKPKIIQAPTTASMYQALAADIQALLVNNYTHIGIIVKSSADCAEAEQKLSNTNMQTINVISSRDTALKYTGGIVILPVDLAKGIEFQAALVLDVNATKYQADVEYDARLLYVAVTRALHVLNLYTCAPLSPLLESSKDVAEVIRIP